ncbi:hypothetical protein ALQ25_02866 [Pseudomonas coronafaciens pv. atropurpurea]|nr:hypothetical protein ALQ25_02866 [Pseudomonas coronafaciens pv. atropurpurea]
MTIRAGNWIWTALASQIEGFGKGYAKLLSLANYQAFR